MEAGARRAALVWPRRAGKDTVSLQWTCWDMHRHIGNYWHLFPEQTQARRAIWNGVNAEGVRIIDLAFPPELRDKTLDNEMFIKFKCGSTWQLGGSDRYDALVGSNPRGVVFSEYAISNPKAYEFVRPILAENQGWALFPYTPRGRNHGFSLYSDLMDDEGSFAELLTCNDTGHMTDTALALEKREMSAGLYLQEYFTSWDYGSEGSYYVREMNKAQTDGRICDVPYDPMLPVWVSWDLGMADSTALWFLQIGPGGQLRWIDYYESSGEALRHYVEIIKGKPYIYGDNLILPHDAAVRELSSGVSRAQTLTELGCPNRILKIQPLMDGIEAVRVGIAKSVFDKGRTEQGRACLTGYHKERDEKNDCWKVKPVHDWSEHGASSYRYMVQAVNAGFCSMGWGGTVDYSIQNRAVI